MKFHALSDYLIPHDGGYKEGHDQHLFFRL
jgi:hypothetical protein